MQTKKNIRTQERRCDALALRRASRSQLYYWLYYWRYYWLSYWLNAVGHPRMHPLWMPDSISGKSLRTAGHALMLMLLGIHLHIVGHPLMLPSTYALFRLNMPRDIARMFWINRACDTVQKNSLPPKIAAVKQHLNNTLTIHNSPHLQHTSHPMNNTLWTHIIHLARNTFKKLNPHTLMTP